MPDQYYVDGAWRAGGGTAIPVVNPADDSVIDSVPSVDSTVVDAAVGAARRAFPGWADTPVADRVALLDRVHALLAARADEVADLISDEMGAPRWFSRLSQVPMPLKDLDFAARGMEALALAPEERIGPTLVVREPAGVVAAITPWNFPLHQIAAKLAPALAAGCTFVLKPSEVAPLNAYRFVEMLDEAGVPPGVVNLVSGYGPTVGAALAAHSDVDVVSFTGSTRAGREIAAAAAPTLKRLALELGGKSANVILDDADLSVAVPTGVKQCFANSGQACASLSRMLVPRSLLSTVESMAVEAARGWTVGDPRDESSKLGPVASRAQQDRVFSYIRSGVDQGAKLLCGGPSAPPGLEHGAYVTPTVFTGVTPDMTIAQEEIFGPVLSIMAYDDEDEALAIANGTPYGLSGGVWSADRDRAGGIARRMRTGQVVYNGEPLNLRAPFGGVKQSGIGREYGHHALHEFLELKSLQGLA